MTASKKQGGVPPLPSFSDGTATIFIKHSLKGASIDDMAKAGGGGQIIPGEEVEEIPPAKSVHGTLGELSYSVGYNEFEDLPGKELVVPYGDGWMSGFTALDGFSKIKAYRLTLIGTQYQYSVVCKCPDFRFDEYKDIFMDVIKSVDRK